MNQISEFLLGDNSERAFRVIVHAYQDKVIRFISLFVHNDQECEELASDVFLSLLVVLRLKFKLTYNCLYNSNIKVFFDFLI